MNEFVWTFAVASVAFIAGYMMCALLSLDTRQKNERAVRRVRGMAEAAIAAHDDRWHLRGSVSESHPPRPGRRQR